MKSLSNIIPNLSLSLALALGIMNVPVMAQDAHRASLQAQKPNEYYLNWHNMDNKKDKKPGVSTEEAYKFLAGKKTQTVVVAVIDGGVDINHEDLKGQIWVNKGEIADNGIDDDHNGYIDDINGWNYLGNTKGENIEGETKEETRIIAKFKRQFETLTMEELANLTGEEAYNYKLYKRARDIYDKESMQAFQEFEQMKTVKTNFDDADALVLRTLNADHYNLNDLYNLQAKKGTPEAEAATYLASLADRGISKKDVTDYFKYVDSKVKYHYNTEYDGRKVIGDDPDNFNDNNYGNNNVSGPDPSHGTFVSGIIAATRANNLGMDGIATDVKIMCLRVVPNGDERDKDIARAIRYAADNGARVINMSFGKSFSLQQHWVIEAAEYAASRNVLLVHAAGNDAENNDIVEHYPDIHIKETSKAIKSWITVGASTITANKRLPANFSNYGVNTVDIFAPGHQIYSTSPSSTYNVESGTSFSCPVVAGVAALILSNYPQLSSEQVKDIILNSGTDFSHKKVFVPNQGHGKNEKLKFGMLSISGKIANACNAVKMADKMAK